MVGEKNLNIILFSYDYSRRGGVERVTSMLYDAMKHSCSITLLDLHRMNSPSFSEGVERNYFSLNVISKSKILRFLYAVNSLRKYYLQIPDRIYIIATSWYLLLIASLASLMVPRDVVKISWEHKQYDKFSSLDRQIMKFVYLFIEAVVVLDDSDFRSVSCDMRVIENIRTVQGNPRLGEKNGNKIVLVGRLVEDKGFARIIHCIHRLNRVMGNWKVLIYGEGPLKDSLGAMIRQLGIQDKVFLKGFEDSVDSIFSAADIFCLTSYSEGVPCALIEALSYKVPALVFDLPSYNTVLDDSNSIRVPQNNVNSFIRNLEYLMNSEKKRKDLSNGLMDSRYGSTGKVKESWLNLLESL